MKTFIYIAGFLFLLPLALLAQGETEDVVYLKNGGILRGEIVELHRDEYLKIKSAGRNVYVVRMDDVREIKSETIPAQKHYKESGYMNRTGFEILQIRDNSSARFYMVNGYQFTSRFAAGLGVGITPYNDPLTLLPVFIDLNYRLHKANASPYLFLKAGYNFSTHHDEDMQIDDHSGGLLFNPGVGVQFNLSSGFGWYINAGYNIDNSSYEFEDWGPQTVKNELSFRRVNFGLGLSF